MCVFICIYMCVCVRVFCVFVGLCDKLYKLQGTYIKISKYVTLL